MEVNTLIRYVGMNYGKQAFTSAYILNDFNKLIHICRNTIYSVIHKAWKMGLFARRKLKGHRFIYHLTAWGERYALGGSVFNRSDIDLKLLHYIMDYGFEKDYPWARLYLIPRLLQRFLPNLSAQSINPIHHFPEAVEKAPSLLRKKDS